MHGLKLLEILDQPRGPETCSSLVLLNPAGQVLLGLRHYTKAQYKDVAVWTTPGGRCDEGESLWHNIMRELLEETGIKNLTGEGPDFWGIVPGAKAGDTLYVFGSRTTKEPRLMEPDKFSQWRWFGVADIPANFINEELRKLIRVQLAR